MAERTTVRELLARERWRPVPGCPGRWVLVGGPSERPPEALLGGGARVESYRVPTARDEVRVARLDGGGLISYRQADGRHVHTLADDEGFGRKLDQLGIQAPTPPSMTRQR